jgi:PAS domain S-box-containing protein
MTAVDVSGTAKDTDAEIERLIDQLHATDERLEQLLDGEVDSVADKSGRFMLLRRAQGHVRQSNHDRQSAIVDALPALIALLDRSGVIISVNKAWRAFADTNGMTDPTYAVGRNYIEQCGPNGSGAIEATRAAEGIRAVLGGTLEAFSMEYSCHAKAEKRWFLLTVTPLPSSPPNGAVVMHLNVTERKLAAQQAEALSLRTARREQMLTTMLSSISDLVYIFDREGRILFANQPLLDLWGLQLEDAIGKNHLEMGYPDKVSAELKGYISRVFDTRKGMSFEDGHIGRGLRDDFHEHVYSPAFSPDGHVDFVVGTSRNITERRRNADALHGLNAELETRVTLRTQALTRQEALFHALADQAPAIIWTLDADQNITYMNRAGLDLLGGSPGDWAGKQLPLHIHPDDLEASEREQNRGVQSSSNFMMIRRLRAQDGSFRIMSCRASPVLDEAGKVDFWVGLEVDITDVKEVESTLRASIRELEAFAYSIAHDLRSPLTLIDGFGHLLEKELGTLVSTRAIHYFSRMRAGIKQMDEVSAGLLSLAGVSRSVLKLEMVDLSRVAR